MSFAGCHLGVPAAVFLVAFIHDIINIVPPPLPWLLELVRDLLLYRPYHSLCDGGVPKRDVVHDLPLP